MDAFWKPIIWQQFGAAIDMMENAIVACPDHLWSDNSRQPAFWYNVYHALFYLDLYLDDSVENFMPPAPFNRDDLDPAGLLPESVYSKEQLLAYLSHGRRKCRLTIDTLTSDKARQRAGFEWIDFSFGELLLYNMRHVQHHAAQLNLLLRQDSATVPGWIRQARRDPDL